MLVKPYGFHKVVEKFQRFSVLVEADLDDIAEKLKEKTVEQFKLYSGYSNPRVGRHGDRLGSTFGDVSDNWQEGGEHSVTKTMSLSPFTVIVGNGHPVASYIEYGTKPHIIKPRRAGALAFIPRHGDGTLVITYKVRHPGSPPFAIVGQNIEWCKDLLVGLITTAINKRINQ